MKGNKADVCALELQHEVRGTTGKLKVKDVMNDKDQPPSFVEATRLD